MVDRGLARAEAVQDWAVLRTLCWFRLLLCVALAYTLTLQTIDTAGGPFQEISALYGALGIVLSLVLWRRAFAFRTQVWLHITSDLIVITLLVISAQGITHTVASLLCIPIAQAVMLRRVAFLYATAALSIAVVLAIDSMQPHRAENYPATAALSLAFLAVAYLGDVHVRRIRQADHALSDKHQELSSMQDLAEEILDASTQGLIVLDHDRLIRFVNATAMMLLDKQQVQLPVSLQRFDQLLFDAIDRGADNMQKPGQSTSLRLHTSALRDDSTLVSLVDMREIEALSEQSRLAALGRWSASVAHEIRNPLSAISQAVELLEDDLGAAPQQHRIIDILQRNTLRIDAVIRDVLTLSRPVDSRRTISLSSWLAAFLDEYTQANPGVSLSLSNQLEGEGWIAVDDERLFHIVSNLCENALLHGAGKAVSFRLTTAADQAVSFHCIAVSNPGAPLEPGQINRLFEPFFTTSTRGSGLGLYVARELCEMLGLTLSYDYADGMHCFCVQAPAVDPPAQIAA